jgi:hypothetical protein
MDVTNNWHPLTKLPIGDRLSFFIEKFQYGTNIVFSGPVLKSHPYTRNGNNFHIKLIFDYATGIKLKNTLFCTTCCNEIPFQIIDTPNSWTVKRYAPKSFSIQNNEIDLTFTVVSDSSSQFSLTYMWWSYPQCSLVNSNDLPLTTFKLPLK